MPTATPPTALAETTAAGDIEALIRRMATADIDVGDLLDALASFWASNPPPSVGSDLDDSFHHLSRLRFQAWRAVRAWSSAARRRCLAGGPGPDGFSLRSSGDGACVIAHPRGISVRIERRAMAFAISLADGVMLVAPLSWRVLRAAVRGALALSWRPEGLSEWPRLTVVEPLLACAVGRSVGLVDARFEEGLNAWWLRERCRFSAQARVVCSRLWAAGQRIPMVWLSSDHLLRDRFVLRDVIAHRAASIAAAHIDQLVPAARGRLGIRLGKPHPTELIDRLSPTGDADAALAAMRRWPDLFAMTGTASRALRRTLMNLPPGVPGSVVARLPLVRVTEPLLGRWRFLCYMLPRTIWDAQRMRAIARYTPSFKPPPNLAVLDRANETQLAELVQELRDTGQLGQGRGPVTLAALRDAIEVMLDYPTPYGGTPLGLWRRSTRFHRDVVAQADIAWRHLGAAALAPDPDIFAPREGLCGPDGRNTDPAARETHRNTPTALPPWQLPPDERIRFLGSVDDLLAESRLMRHCVASYVAKAISGHCYVYHVEHTSGPATVELDAQGNVVQSRGPRNVVTPAAKWALRWFGEWRARRQQ